MSDHDIKHALERLAGEPVDDPDRVAARVTHRAAQRRRHTIVGGAVAAVLVVAGGLSVVALDDDDPIVNADDGSSTSSVVDPSSSTTESTEDTTHTTSPLAPVDPSLPLEHGGVGGARVGMTLAEVEAATGQQVTPIDAGMFGGWCYFAELEGVPGLRLWVSYPGSPSETNPEAVDDAGFDPMLGVVGPIEAYEAPWRTAEGIGVGPGTLADIQAAYPGAETEGHTYVAGGWYVYDTDGAGETLSVNQYDGTIHSIWAGRLLIEGCA